MILEQLQRDLVAAAERERRPARRLPVLLPVAAALVAAVVAVVLVRGAEPEREVTVPPSARVTLPVEGVRPPLSLRASVEGGDRVCLAFTRGPDVRDCVPRFSVFESFDVNAAPVTFHVRRVGGAYVVAGVADASVDHVAVVAPEGERAQARVGEPRLALGGLRLRPYVASLPLETHPGELRLTVTHAGAMDDVRVPPPAIPGRTYSLQRPRISLLERPAQPRDVEAAELVRREPEPGGAPSTARVATRYKGRLIYAWVGSDGDVCLSGAGGAGCTNAETAVSDTPMISGTQSSDGRVTAVGLIHDGPAAITLERSDGSKRSVAVVDNVFVFTDRDVVRLRWRGLDGPVTMEYGGG